MKTYSARAGEVEQRWLLVDAEGQTLGRLATHIAMALRGKHKPSYTAHLDTGDFVVVVNAEKVRLTGNKLVEKQYIRHSEYPGGIRRATAGEVLAKHPTRVIYQAVVGMLPKTRLGRRLATKLKVYAGPDHPHQAQKPLPLSEAH